MSSAQCLYHGCRVVPRDERYGGYCHKHRDQSPMAAALSPSSVLTKDELNRYHGSPPRMTVSQSRVARDRIAAHTGLSPGLAGRVVVAYRDEVQQGQDLSIPSRAADLEQPAQRIVNSMVESGVPPNRVSVVKVRGLNRMNMDGRSQRASRHEHEVVKVIAADGSVKIVDPAISKFAPVGDRNKSVDDQIPSGVTPFGDQPWIGDADDYMTGSFLWWDHMDD